MRRRPGQAELDKQVVFEDAYADETWRIGRWPYARRRQRRAKSWMTAMWRMKEPQLTLGMCRFGARGDIVADEIEQTPSVVG
mmetsp:Transcript_7251/g.21919  ORF Transcript_7251/g.21919 Transcript_7251/m.21919 type:complete len:82 (-) Transcript_7251:58-303(-)